MSAPEDRGGIFDHEIDEDAPAPSPDEARAPAPAALPDPEPAVAEEMPVAASHGPEPAEHSPEQAVPRSDPGPAAPPLAHGRPPQEAPASPAAAAAAAASPEHAAGSLQVPAGIRVFRASPNGTRRSVGIAVSSYNGEITSKLLEGALAELEASGVAREAIEVMPVPGAFELPLAAMALAKSRRYSCVLALGCVIRGETPHFDFVAAEAASGVQLAGLETGVPVSFGVLTCDTAAQAEARAGGGHGNKGAEAARSALEMVESLALLRATLAS